MPNYLTGSSMFPDRIIQISTMGKPKPPGLLHDEKISRKRLNERNPALWAQLSAISRGTKVNHLGTGHARSIDEFPGYSTPGQTELCLACAFGNTAVYLHKANCPAVA